MERDRGNLAEKVREREGDVKTEREREREREKHFFSNRWKQKIPSATNNERSEKKVQSANKENKIKCKREPNGRT